jgi:hypothetical protein
MENRKGTLPNPHNRPIRSSSIFYFLISIFACASGCGAPGEPVPPSPPVPQAIGDLTAKQSGDGVLLTFTMPTKSTLAERLPQTPAFEVLRGSLRTDGTPDPKSFRVVDTVPGALVSRYTQSGRVQFVDPVPPNDPLRKSGQAFIYRVRTLISSKHPSVVSKDASVMLYPVPEPIPSLDATVTEQGVELSWRPATGEGSLAVKEYHVYRGELNPANLGTAPADRPQGLWKSPLMQLGVTHTSDYRDSGFDYEKTYAYVVRSVVDSPAGPLESSDSQQAVVTPKDTFPPAPPQDLVAAPQASPASGSAVVELSWSINVEPDLAGYRVYRSSQEGSRGTLLTPDLLRSPSYRDTSVEVGQHYWYTVTAVDRSGNESAPSSAVSVDVAQPSR